MICLINSIVDDRHTNKQYAAASRHIYRRFGRIGNPCRAVIELNGIRVIITLGSNMSTTIPVATILQRKGKRVVTRCFDTKNRIRRRFIDCNIRNSQVTIIICCSAGNNRAMFIIYLTRSIIENCGSTGSAATTGSCCSKSKPLSPFVRRIINGWNINQKAGHTGGQADLAIGKRKINLYTTSKIVS